MNELPENYIVQCDRSKVHCNEVYNHYYNDNWKVNSEWKYIICSNKISNAQYKVEGVDNSGDCISKNISSEYQDLPILTYKQWKQLKETNMKIIKGYRLNGVVDARTAAYSLGCSSVISSDGLFLNECTQRAIVKAKEIKVLDIWFDVVYEDEYKVGEFVIVEGYSKNFNGRPLEISAISESIGTKYYYFVGGVHKNFRHDMIQRKATAEEIKRSKTKLPRINGYDGALNTSKRIVTYGCGILSVSVLEKLAECNHFIQGNRQIKKITLDSGVDITMEEINQILEYIKIISK